MNSPKTKQKIFFLISRLVAIAIVLLLTFIACNQKEPDSKNPPSERGPRVFFESIGEISVQGSTDPIYVKQQGVPVKISALSGNVNVAIAEVQLFVDGTAVNPTKTAPPYEFKINIPKTDTVLLEALATDTDGKQSERAKQEVIVDNSKPTFEKVELRVNSKRIDIEGNKPVVPPVNKKDEVTLIVTPNDNLIGTDKTIVKLEANGVEKSGSGKQSYKLHELIDFTKNNAVSIVLTVVDLAGNESESIEFELTLKDSSTGPVFELPTVKIDTVNIEPGTIPNANEKCSMLACYAGTISIPIRVEDETGTAKVTLIVDSVARGKFPLTTLSSPPYIFTLNTFNYPNNDKLTLTTKVVSSAGEGDDSKAETIEIFNEAPPAVLSINSPANGDTVSGILPVSVTLSQLTNSDYTLDLNNDNQVDASVDGAEQEGILIEIIDYTGELVAKQRLSGTNVVGAISPVRGGSYTTLKGFDTNKVSNDSYTLRVTVKAQRRNNGSVNGQVDLTLVRKIEIITSNDSRVPPSVLILSPTNPKGVVRTIRSPTNAYVTAQVTDNTGVAFIDLRIFTGDVDDDSTPSRFVYDASDNVDTDFIVAALPINFNADPYVVDGKNYKIRVVAEDVDGNRNSQDITINLIRSPDAGYKIRRISPIENLGNAGDPPCQRLVNPVFTNVRFTLAVALEFRTLVTCTGQNQTNLNSNPPPEIVKPVSNGDTFDHFLQRPGSSTFSAIGTTGTLDETVGGGFNTPGAYTYFSQITTADGDIYITNLETVPVLKPESQK